MDTLKPSKPARTFSSILAVLICAVEVGQVTDFNWSWCLYEHRGRNTPITGRPTMTNWFHHLLTGNVALARQPGLILGTQNMLFEGILSRRKHSCCFVSGGCQHVAQFIKCIEIFGFLSGMQQQNKLPCCSDTTV